MSLPWADQPYSLIPTDPYSKDTTHAAYYVATQMALAHNGIIRGLNSIYLQAPYIPNDAIQDFLTYCQCWAENIHHHHDAEEIEFFPSMENISNIPGLMETNIEQHREFTPGFELFQAFCQTCQVKDFDGSKVRNLIEGFAEPLIRHLSDEIDTLRALDVYDSKSIREAYQRFEKLVTTTDNYRIAPIVFGTADKSFEGGMHKFPPVPFFVPYIIHYWFGRRYRAIWKFNPCTMWGERKELAYGEASAS